MTRKDYGTIAGALARVRPSNLDTIADHELAAGRGFSGPLDLHSLARQWLVTRDAIAGALQADNPRFDRVRFFAATER
jgi:hypothetical protein